MTINLVALIYPKPDKVARVEEIAQSIAEHVQANEPGVLQYKWFRVVDAEVPTLMVWETYADQAAVDAHKASPKMAWLMEVEKEEGNMAAPLKIMPLEAFAGWASR